MAREKGGRTTVFINAHGGADMKTGVHSVMLNGQKGGIVPSAGNIQGNSRGFRQARRRLHGQLLWRRRRQDTDALPKGSTFVALAPGSEEVQVRDVERLLDVLRKKHDGRAADTSAEGLLDTYLAGALKNRIAPVHGRERGWGL